MASSARNDEREEERRHNMRTLVIASVASATAAAVTSQLWIHGTWIAAAMTPVMVTLISEAMHRPTERIARAWTSDRPALDAGAVRDAARRAPGDEALPEAAGAAPPPPRGADPLPQRAAPEPRSAGEPGAMRVYRQPTARAPRRRLALGAVAATAAVAFVIGVVALTAADLIAGDSIGKGSGRSTLLGGGGSGRDKQQPEQDASPKQREAVPEQQSTTDTAPPTTETAPEPQPTETAPTTPLPQTPPGEPAPDAAPTP